MNGLQSIANIPADLAAWWNSGPKERADFERNRSERERTKAGQDLTARRAIAAEYRKAIAAERQDAEIQGLKAKIDSLNDESNAWRERYRSTNPGFAVQIQQVSQKLLSRIQKHRAAQDALRKQLVESTPLWQTEKIDRFLSELEGIDRGVLALDTEPLQRETNVFGHLTKVLDWKEFREIMRGVAFDSFAGRQATTGWIGESKIAAGKLRCEVFETPEALDAEFAKIRATRPTQKPTWRNVQ